MRNYARVKLRTNRIGEPLLDSVDKQLMLERPIGHLPSHLADEMAA